MIGYFTLSFSAKSILPQLLHHHVVREIAWEALALVLPRRRILGHDALMGIEHWLVPLALCGATNVAKGTATGSPSVCTALQGGWPHAA